MGAYDVFVCPRIGFCDNVSVRHFLDMNLPNFQTFLRPILEVLSDGAISSRRDIISLTLKKFSFTDEELALRHEQGGSLVLAGRVGWALTYLKQAGLVTSPARAASCITEEGKKALRSGDEINRAYLNRFASFRQFLDKCKHTLTSASAQPTGGGEEQEDPLEKINEACNALKTELKDEIVSALLKLKETEFERFCVDLLLRMGYGNPTLSRVTQATGDGGIDGIVTSDRLGFDKVYVQAKLYSPESSISEGVVRDFIGAIDNQEASGRGVFITTSKFSKGAEIKAHGSKHHKIMLINGERLAELMIEFGVGVTTTNTFTVKELDSAFYEQYDQK